MSVAADISVIIESCTTAICQYIKAEIPTLDVYYHEAKEDIGDNGAMVTLYEYEVYPAIGGVNKWELKYGIQLFQTSQVLLVNNTNHVIEVLSRTLDTDRFGKFKPRGIRAVTDYYKTTSRLTSMIFYVDLWIKQVPTEPTVLMQNYDLDVIVKEKE
jgi:hypothetical protein